MCICDSMLQKIQPLVRANKRTQARTPTPNRHLHVLRFSCIIASRSMAARTRADRQIIVRRCSLIQRASSCLLWWRTGSRTFWRVLRGPYPTLATASEHIFEPHSCRLDFFGVAVRGTLLCLKPHFFLFLRGSVRFLVQWVSGLYSKDAVQVQGPELCHENGKLFAPMHAWLFFLI